jgi:hypothetical protein
MNVCFLKKDVFGGKMFLKKNEKNSGGPENANNLPFKLILACYRGIAVKL